MKLKVKELKDVDCPDCEGKGKVSIGAPEPYDIEEECDRCGGTGELEIEVEYCRKCGEELEWNEWLFDYDEETDTMYRCVNKCEGIKADALLSALKEKKDKLIK